MERLRDLQFHISAATAGYSASLLLRSFRSGKRRSYRGGKTGTVRGRRGARGALRRILNVTLDTGSTAIAGLATPPSVASCEPVGKMWSRGIFRLTEPLWLYLPCTISLRSLRRL